MILFSMFSTCSIHSFILCTILFYNVAVLGWSLLLLPDAYADACLHCIQSNPCIHPFIPPNPDPFTENVDDDPHRIHVVPHRILLLCAHPYLLLIYKRSMIIKSAAEQHSTASSSIVLLFEKGNCIRCVFDVDDEDDKLNLYLIWRKYNMTILFHPEFK